MTKAVVDTNLFVAGLLNDSGAPAKLILRWLKGQFEVVISEQIMEEYSFVLRYLQTIDQNKVTKLFEDLRSKGISIKIPGTLKECKDPDDDKFLETAVIGKTNFLVTKNTRHFPFKSFQNVRIVKVSKFLKELEKQYPD